MPADGQLIGAESPSEEAAPEGCEPANNLQMQAERNAGGQFLKGQSGNPAGRVSGTRNRATMIMEQLFDGASSDVSKEALAQAMNGDGATLRLIVRSVIGPGGTGRRASRCRCFKAPRMWRRPSRRSPPPRPRARSRPP